MEHHCFGVLGALGPFFGDLGRLGVPGLQRPWQAPGAIVGGSVGALRRHRSATSMLQKAVRAWMQRGLTSPLATTPCPKTNKTRYLSLRFADLSSFSIIVIACSFAIYQTFGNNNDKMDANYKAK